MRHALLLVSWLFAGLVSGCAMQPQSEITVSESTAEAAPASTDSAPPSRENALRMAIEAMGELAPDDIGLLVRVHYATHTPDFDRARAFYRTLGYTEGVTGFPLTNTHQMARALGMFDECQYELAKGEVMSLPGSPNPASIDLLQFKTPFNGAPPYDLPNHLGMAYAVYKTANFDADVATLTSIGTQFLADPYGQQGSRFLFFRDPDGVLYKLVESQGGKPADSDMHIFDMPYVAINVSDLDESLAFYARFGYQPLGEPELKNASSGEGQAYGLDSGFTVRTVDVAITKGDKHRLRLSQWVTPFNSEPAYPPPINHIGINRLAVLVTDLDRAVDILKAQDVPFLSELAPCCSGTADDESAIVHAIDPDGVFIELVGSIKKRPLQPQPQGCPALEIKYPTTDG